MDLKNTYDAIVVGSGAAGWPNGLANSSSVLGRYLMDDIGGPSISGFLPLLMGRKPVNDDGKSTSVLGQYLAGAGELCPYLLRCQSSE